MELDLLHADLLLEVVVKLGMYVFEEVTVELVINELSVTLGNDVELLEVPVPALNREANAPVIPIPITKTKITPPVEFKT